MKTLKKFFNILSKKNKIKSFYLLLLVLIGVIFEMLSIGLLLPLLTAMSNESQNQYINLDLIYNLPWIEFRKIKPIHTILVRFKCHWR